VWLRPPTRPTGVVGSVFGSRAGAAHPWKGWGVALHWRAVVEILFMMVVLKLPIVYLAAVIYWAVKAEPRPYEGALLPVADDAGPQTPRRPTRRPKRGGPHGSPTRREDRYARARPGRPSRA
jgi:hypothetical protein